MSDTTNLAQTRELNGLADVLDRVGDLPDVRANRVYWIAVATAGTKLRQLTHESRAQPASVADGWVMVPREPTDAMTSAAVRMLSERGVEQHDYVDCTHAWSAMLAAAPQSAKDAQP